MRRYCFRLKTAMSMSITLKLLKTRMKIEKMTGATFM
jgi:hypothetical protein